MNLQSCNVSSRHALRFDGPINNIHEAPAIGNGDIGALVQIFQDEFRLHLGKNDVWDARFDYDTAKGVLKQDDLIRASRDFGFRLEGANYEHGPKWDREPDFEYPDDNQGWGNINPCPKPAGCIRVLHSGSSNTRIEASVDIERGVVNVAYHMEYGWHGSGSLYIEAFVARDSNAICLRLRAEGTMGHFYLCVEKEPDSLDPSLPAPVVVKDDDRHGTVSQTVPGEFDVEPFSWHLAGSYPAAGEGRSVKPLDAQVWRLRQVCELKDGATAEFSVGVATDRDGSPHESRERAIALAEDVLNGGFDAALARHTAKWRTFWDASGIELEDRELEAAWYRSLFALNCHIAPGAQAPGLCANVVPAERSPWHGGYTVNMNIQKMFLASLPTHHPEWIECYAGWIDSMMPSFRFLAREIFDLEGIYSPHMLMPFVPPHRQANANTCGRALGMIGWHGQPLWWHWEYTGDREFLEQRAYPFLKEAANFYWRYLEKYLDESGDLYPSLILEHPPWTRNFERNRDCFTDLILFRNTFEYAIKASEELGVDDEWRQRWCEAIEKVRPVHHEELPDGSHWVASDRNAPRPTEPEWWKLPAHRPMAMTAAWSIFPGEWVDGDETEGLAVAARDVLERLNWKVLHPDIIWIHHWWCCIPALRLGMPGAWEQTRETILKELFPAGHVKTTHWINLQPEQWRVPEENYLASTATTEMLLQSQGQLLRFFPMWPRDKWARLRDLPARGAFVVSAQWQPGKGFEATIRSVHDTQCHIRWYGEALPVVTCDGQAVEVRRGEREIVFEALKGFEYLIVAASPNGR